MKQNRLINTIGLVTLVTLFAKLLGIVREALQARAFGTLAAADLYTTASNNTIYLFTTVAYALCIAAVPILTPRLRRDRQEGYDAAGNIISVTVLLSAVVTVGWIIASFTPWTSSLVQDAESASLLGSYMRIMALTLPIIVLTYLLVALFQSMEHFVLQGSMSIPYNLVLILFLFLFSDKLGVSGYVIAVAAAWLLQLGMTAPYAVKERVHLRLKPDLRADYLRVYFKTAVVTVLTTSIFLFCYLQDSSMTVSLSNSPVSAFYYADKLFTPLTTTLIYSVSSVLFPKFSREYASGEQEHYLQYVWGILRGTLLLILPVSAVLSVFGTPIVRVLFEGGSFDASSTAATGGIFTVYALSMAGFCVLDLLSKAYYTMEKTLTPLLVNAGILLCNWVLNRLLGSYLGGTGLAAATAISISLGGIVMAVLFFRKAGKIELLPLVKSAAAAVVTGVVLKVMTSFALSGAEGKIALMIKCAALGIGAVILYALLLLALRQEDFRQFLSQRGKS